MNTLASSRDGLGPGQARSARLDAAAARPTLATPTAVLLAFVALFPGHFVYHALVLQGMPPVLRGYSVLMSAMVLPLLALPLARSLAAGHATWIDALFFGFVALLLGVSAVHFALGANPVIVSGYLASAVQWLALYGVVRVADAGERRLRRVATGAWLVMSAIVLANATEASFIVAALDLDDDRATLATYQDFALLYLVVTLMCLAHARSAWRRTVLLAVATVVLFVNGARSEFVAFLLGAFVMGWCRSRWRVAIVIGAAAMAGALWMAAGPLAELLPDNRIIDLIENRAESSYSQRQEMLAHGLSTIADHPLLGRFASYEPGEYIHGVLSAWVDLGVVGLLALALLLALPLLELTGQFGRRGREGRYLLPLVLLLVCALLLAVSKMFLYSLVPLAVGAYAHDLARRTRRRRSDAPVP